jgi:hypothetical protein
MDPPAGPAPGQETRVTRPRNSTATVGKPNEQSVLRRTTYEEEIPQVAPQRLEVANAMPIIRSQSPAEDRGDFEIPYNPLRR